MQRDLEKRGERKSEGSVDFSGKFLSKIRSSSNVDFAVVSRVRINSFYFGKLSCSFSGFFFFRFLRSVAKEGSKEKKKAKR